MEPRFAFQIIQEKYLETRTELHKVFLNLEYVYDRINETRYGGPIVLYMSCTKYI